MSRKSPVIDPLAPEIAQLLAADRAVAPLAVEVEERIQRRIAATLKLPLAVPGTGDGADEVSSTDSSDMLAEPLTQTGTTATKLATLKTVAIFVAGIATGVTGHAVYESVWDDQDLANENGAVKIQQALPDNPDHNPMLDSSVPDDASTEIPEVAISIESPKTVIEAANRKTQQKKEDSLIVITEKPEEPQIEQQRARILSAEQQLIEMAQSALARGRPQDALRALKRHSITFSPGERNEEREALTVLSLIKLGKRQEAEILFTRFRKRYPQSMFNRTISEALKPD